MLGFYDGRRVLVTGHTGFKGGWLVIWLKALGAEVCGIGLAPDTTPNLHDLARVSHGIRSHIVDLADAEQVASIVQDFRPEVIFHLGAQPLVRLSYNAPVTTYMANVMGSLHLLEAARHQPSVRAVVMVTSDKVYQNDEKGVPFSECDRLGGSDPYSSSKACAEIAIQSWRKSFFDTPAAARVASARAGNVIGGGDWCADRLVPDIVRAIATGQDIVLRNPASVRPWQHVVDVLAGYLNLGARLANGGSAFSDAWNFGPPLEEKVAVGELAERIISIWGRGRVQIELDRAAPKEAQTLRLDSSKSRRELAWRPMLPINDAIDWTVDWYRRVLDDPDSAPAITAEQLEHVMARLKADRTGDQITRA